MIVDTEKVLREADGPMKRAVPRPAMRDGWKGVRPGVRLKSWTVRAGEEPEEHKRLELYDLEIHLKKIGPDYHGLKTMVSSRTYEIRILAPEMEIMRRTPWSRIRGQNSVYKEFLEIVGNGKPTGSVLKETIAVSVTILISVEK